jgi:hypothetical protein
MSEQHDIARAQTEFLESLGIYQAGFAPADTYGRGRIRYRDIDLADRLALAGFQGHQLRKMFTGEVAMTTRTALRLGKASWASHEDRDPLVGLSLVIDEA